MDQSQNDWRTYAADLFQHHELVLERLASKNPTVDREDLHDAFVKSILEIAVDPAKFDSSRGSTIEDFLTGASQRSLLQIIRTGSRRVSREEKKAIAVVNERSAARSPADMLADGELAEYGRTVAETDNEKNVLRLWELGHSDAEIAIQLQLSDGMARQIRDRLTQRLRRLRKNFDD